MVEKILIFLIFLCPLIFFHELGHFFFARFFGVKVEVFSIGFGPKIFNFKYRGTQYALSLIPLGGYVKMFGDDPFERDKLTEKERKDSFIYKSKWARFWIVFGGPLANFILAFIIFFVIFLKGEQTPEYKLGEIVNETQLYKLGFRSGDIIEKVNGEAFAYANEAENSKTGNYVFELKRNEQSVQVIVDAKGINVFEEIFNSGSRLRIPILVDKRGNYYYVGMDRDKRDLNISLEELQWAHPSKIFLFRVSPESVQDYKLEKDITFTTELKLDGKKTLIEEARGQNYFPIDLMVSKVLENSPALKEGIKVGDIISTINGEEIYSFEDLRSKLQKGQNEIILGIFRFAELKQIKIIPTVTDVDGTKVKTIGVYNSLQYIPPKMVKNEGHSFIDAAVVSFQRMSASIFKILDGFKKLVFNQVSLKTVGGPLAIGKVATDSFALGIEHFFKLMALISINLGIINLFPIPILDGGHIMFLFFELINRGPLSQKKLEVAQQFGATLLFILVFVALFNDVTRIIQN